MCDKEFKELVKIAVEKLKDESVLKLLQADASYQKDSKTTTAVKKLKDESVLKLLQADCPF